MLLAVLLTASCAGCSDDSKTATSGGEVAPATDAGGGATDTGPAAVDPATVGSVSGVVRYDGPPVEITYFNPLGESFCIEHSDNKMPDESLLVEDGKLVNAFVWIETGLDGFEFPVSNEKVQLDQQGCVFLPRVFGLQEGQDVHVSNSDPILHNVHFKPARGRGKNVAMPAGATPRDFDFKAPDVMMSIICDVHSYMRSFVGVLEHPCFAVTGADGSFDIQGVPPGDYTLSVWHETLGRRQAEITVGASEAVVADDFVYTP
jgi:plastocyanin